MAGMPFTDAERDSFYRLVAERRDMRHFTPEARVEPAVLQRLLTAARQAPSVGMMEPTRFIRIANPALREQLYQLVQAERLRTADTLGEQREAFLKLRVEGIREAAELLVAVLAPDDGTVFGRRTLPQEMALASLACAIQNLWLAARVENLGLGWVSFFDPLAVGELLHLPPGARAMALLCVGPVPDFYPKPMLEQVGWRQRALDRPLYEEDRWPASTPPS
jgi:5,6-dimethylbenzimidazole synthase